MKPFGGQMKVTVEIKVTTDSDNTYRYSDGDEYLFRTFPTQAMFAKSDDPAGTVGVGKEKWCLVSIAAPWTQYFPVDDDLEKELDGVMDAIRKMNTERN
jgi:hypothetical protein